jgi:anti-sigma B factor antagonist
MSLTITVKEIKPGLQVVALDGRLDTDSSPRFEKVIGDFLAEEPKVVWLDLAALSYLSSMGIRALHQAYKDLQAKKGRLLLVNIQPQIKKVLDVARTLPPESFATVKEADEYFDAIQRKAQGRREEGGR